MALDITLVCSICGMPTGGSLADHNPWVRDLRAVLYGDDWLQATISENLVLNASEQIHEFLLSGGHYISGSLIHNKCYEVLEFACHPTPINVQILNLFLQSFGLAIPNLVDSIFITSSVLNWGHGYAGLYQGSDTQFRRLKVSHNLSPTQIRTFVDSPCSDGEFESRIIRLSAEEPTNPRKSENTNKYIHTISDSREESCPVLETLPEELLEMILSLLPTEDVVHARIASRALALCHLSQNFWRSRFAVGAEFGYIPEPWLYKEKLIQDRRYADAQVVYRVAKSDRRSLSFFFNSRRRVWDLVQPLANALTSFSRHAETWGSVEPRGHRMASLWQPRLEKEDKMTWVYAHGDLHESREEPFHEGCRPLFKRSISLPSQPVAAIGVSMLPFHGTTYITGLRFFFDGGRVIPLGYILYGREIKLDIQERLHGFTAYTGDRGVHGLSVLTNDLASDVVGDIVGFTQTCLKSKKVTRAVKACFDGMKMVWLGVTDDVATMQVVASSVGTDGKVD
ncbi:hypothetical protein P154DRAFT_575917 [Amniculicola lignicola CBS 123094]|uniref:F-box domain-containing protein n=1 Tax=Amniculicola lignicola CBS 123094 TaxID=1392246 RepID=A0A6A5WNB3_9PLEO|nr:hypothetical protein P154DRAFT_575917 [Amniculicola lignicola CBS 123094]